MPADGLQGEQPACQALAPRQRHEDDPQEGAERQPQPEGVGAAADQAQAATQPVQRSAEEGLLRAFHGSDLPAVGRATLPYWTTLLTATASASE